MSTVWFLCVNLAAFSHHCYRDVYTALLHWNGFIEPLNVVKHLQSCHRFRPEMMRSVSNVYILSFLFWCSMYVTVVSSCLLLHLARLTEGLLSMAILFIGCRSTLSTHKTDISIQAYTNQIRIWLIYRFSHIVIYSHELIYRLCLTLYIPSNFGHNPGC